MHELKFHVIFYQMDSVVLSIIESLTNELKLYGIRSYQIQVYRLTVKSLPYELKLYHFVACFIKCSQWCRLILNRCLMNRNHIISRCIVAVSVVSSNI